MATSSQLDDLSGVQQYSTSSSVSTSAVDEVDQVAPDITTSSIYTQPSTSAIADNSQPPLSSPKPDQTSDLTQSEAKVQAADSLDLQSSSLVPTSTSASAASSQPIKIDQPASAKVSSSASNSGNSSKSYSPSPNFPQMVFSFLPLSSAMETTLKATNFAATAFSKALSTSSSALNTVSSVENLSSPSNLPSATPQSSLSSSQHKSSAQSSTSSALPYVHLPGVLTALDQAVQEYDVLLSENGAVAFMRPDFAPQVKAGGPDELQHQQSSHLLELLDDRSSRLVEVKVLTKEALLSFASSPPLGYLPLMEALKVGSPVPMRQLKASSLAKLLNSVEAIFTRASDLVEATSPSTLELEDTKEREESDTVTAIKLEDNLCSSRTASTSSSTVMADDALTSLLFLEPQKEMPTTTTTSLANDAAEGKQVDEKTSNFDKSDGNQDENEDSGERHSINQDEPAIKISDEKVESKPSLDDQSSGNSTAVESSTTATTQVDEIDYVAEVAQVTVATESNKDAENVPKEVLQCKELSLPKVILQPPTPTPPPPPSAPRRDSFLHGPRSKRYVIFG